MLAFTAMNAVLISILSALILSFRSRLALQAEILALRHQLNVLQRSSDARIQLRTSDRLLWVWLSRLWNNWRSALLIVKPETVIRWHRQSFRLYWRWKSRRPGRPQAGREIRELIRRMCLIVINASSLHRTLKSSFAYYHDSRCHLALNKDSPDTREVQPPDKGIVVEIPRVGGLHHRYQRCAA